MINQPDSFEENSCKYTPPQSSLELMKLVMLLSLFCGLGGFILSACSPDVESETIAPVPAAYDTAPAPQAGSGTIQGQHKGSHPN